MGRREPPDLRGAGGVLAAWFARRARDLPWRPGSPGTAWGVLVSEVMLQQTPVDRVAPVWREWLARWPGPADLAAVDPGAAIRAWGRLGYPRRALRLHAAAGVIVERHGGQVPGDPEALRALPGVGEYTAAAVAAFAFGHPVVALDTNVRRVIARHDAGTALPAAHVTRAERQRAADLCPPEDGAGWLAAVMELGALVCTVRAPACAECPVRAGCAWRRAGYPAAAAPARTQPRYAGSDRQARGALLAVLRESAEPVPGARLDAAWADARQRARALDSLAADGLVEPVGRDHWRLPAGGG